MHTTTRGGGRKGNCPKGTPKATPPIVLPASTTPTNCFMRLSDSGCLVHGRGLQGADVVLFHILSNYNDMMIYDMMKTLK